MSVVAEREVLNLERAIERELNLGEKDPHVIYEKLEQHIGAEELLRLAVPYIPDLIAEMARQRIGQQRRQAIAKISSTSLQDPEIMIRSLWVPSEQGIVYKRIADMTAEDFIERAEYLERMVIGISRHAEWCRDVAKAIKKAKVQTAGKLEALPGLPELEA